MRVILSPNGHLTMSRDNLLSQVGQWGGRVLLSSSGKRPDMLLNILQWTGQAPTTKNYPAQKVDSAEEIEKPSSRLIAVHQGEMRTIAT